MAAQPGRQRGPRLRAPLPRVRVSGREPDRGRKVGDGAAHVPQQRARGAPRDARARRGDGERLRRRRRGGRQGAGEEARGGRGGERQRELRDGALDERVERRERRLELAHVDRVDGGGGQLGDALGHAVVRRARFAAGDPAVGALFEEVRRKVLTMPRDPALFRDEVRKMRDKMTSGHPNKTDLFDIKHDKGGMVDLEFVTQYLVLTQADQHPEMIGNLGNIALLRIAGEVGLLDPDLAARVGNAYRNLRRRQHAVRLQGAEHARVGQDELQEEREAVKTLWRQVIG